jgi:integration host factor subunit alpha
MTLTKADLVQKIMDTAGLPRKEAIEAFETTFELIKAALESGEHITISGIGRFDVKEKHPRKGRNPQTGKDMILDGRRVAVFRCSKKLRERINNGFSRR